MRLPLLVLGGAALAVAVRVLELPAPVRGTVLGAFLLLCPGAALIGDPRSWPRPAWWTAVLASSVALSILVSALLLYAGVWSPDRVLAALAAGSVAGAGFHLLRAREAAA